MSTPSPWHIFTTLYWKFLWKFPFMNHFSWYPALPCPVHLIRESGGHGGKLDLCVFSWLTGENLSLPVPVEKERIVECRPWQSIPSMLMVGLSWTAGFTADIYTQLTQVSGRGKTERVKGYMRKKNARHALTCIWSSSNSWSVLWPLIACKKFSTGEFTQYVCAI